MTTFMLLSKLTLKLSEVEGLPLPPSPGLKSWAKHIASMRKVEMRSDDILLCAYPKAGTHWIWEIICMLLAGEAVYETRAKELLMMDLSKPSTLEKLQSPRVLNTHLPFSMLPTRSILARRVKIVHVYRNPRDIMVSSYHHFKQFKLIHTESLQAYSKAFLAGKVAYGHYAHYLNQMNGFSQNNPDLPIFHVSFEQMKLDPHSAVRRLAEYLGVPATETLIMDIVNACTFNKLKNVDTSKEQIRFLGLQLEHNVYRKGEVGDWQNHLTEEESTEFQRDFNKVLDNDQFPFVYNV